MASSENSNGTDIMKIIDKIGGKDENENEKQRTVMTGGSQKSKTLNIHSINDEYYEKYMKYKSKYNNAKQKLFKI